MFTWLPLQMADFQVFTWLAAHTQALYMHVYICIVCIIRTILANGYTYLGLLCARQAVAEHHSTSEAPLTEDVSN